MTWKAILLLAVIAVIFVLCLVSFLKRMTGKKSCCCQNGKSRKDGKKID